MSKLSGKVLKSQTREVIYNVMEFMKKEADHGGFLIDCKKVRERVSAAVGVSRMTLARINQEAKRQRSEGQPLFETPNKKRKRKKPVTDLDDFDKSVIRRMINGFYLVEKCLPTLPKLHSKLVKDIGFNGGKTSLRTVIKQLGFKWKKTRNNRHVLIEQQHIAFHRHEYLKNIRKYREEGRPVVYMDETYIHSSHVSQKSWADNNNDGVAIPLTKGARLIIIHAGGEMGFIENCFTMWKSSLCSGDYHSSMNFENYQKWLTEKLIPNLPEKSVLVIDNAPYHNVQSKKCPTSASTKSNMQEWLRSNRIPFDDSMLKVQLLQLISLHKPRNKEYVIDSLLQQHGHTVLRLPPYHPELNPIELIWAEVKNWVATNNTTFTIEDVKQLTVQKFGEITRESWQKKCDHVKKVEEDYVTSQPQIENAVENFIIQLGGETSDTDEDGASGCSQMDTDSEETLSGIEDLM